MLPHDQKKVGCSMTLIEVRGKGGELIGRCDARCYNAKEPHCECICGGRNHGAGLQKAIEQTREQAERWIEAYAERLGLAEYTGMVSRQLDQMTIFELMAELEREAECMKAVDTIHRYKPPGSGIEARCRVQVHRHEGQTVAIVTELPDNPGMSVTNAAEWLLPALAEQYGLPDGTVWIEHYERLHGEPDTYDLVTLRGGSPSWRRLALEQVERLIGAEVMA